MNWKLILRICSLIDYLEQQRLIDISEEEAEVFLNNTYYYVDMHSKPDYDVLLKIIWSRIGWENKPSKEIIEIVKNFGLEDE